MVAFLLVVVAVTQWLAGRFGLAAVRRPRQPGIIATVSGEEIHEERRRSIDLIDYWTPIMLRAVIDAGVIEALGHGPRTAEELAAETGTHGPTLARVLRALAGRGIVHERNDGCYELTPIGEPFLVAHPDALRGLSSLPSFELHAWAEFEHTLFTGEVAFNHHYGKSFFEWLAENPDRSARFDRHMERRTATLLKTANPLVEQLPETGLVVDVGGGNGSFLASVLKARPALTGIVFDLPHVVAAAEAIFSQAGVADRARGEAGDFFKAVPPGADAYTILSVLHDWDDPQVLRILECVRGAMPETSRMLIGDCVLSGPNEWDHFKNIDLHMLVNIGGRERSEEEWRTLLGRAGFDTITVTRSPSLGCIAATRG